MSGYSYAVCSDCGGFNRFVETRENKRPICGKCKKPLTYHSGVTEVDSAGLQKLIDNAPIPVVVDFWAEWCGPCRFFAPIFESVAKEHFARAVFAKLDTESSPEASGRHRITAIPTLLVFRDGRETHRQQGALAEPAFRHLVESVL